jgi:hypothetical protein
MKSILRPLVAACVALACVAPLTAQTDKKDQAPKKAEPKRFNIEFREKHWSDVFEWLSEQTGLPVISIRKVPGTFTFQPVGKKGYTLPEIVDVMNEALKNSGYQFARKSDSLVVMDVDKEPAQPPGDGDFEVIRLKASKAVEVAKLLDEAFNGPRGGGRGQGRLRVLADPASNSLLMRATPADMLVVRRLLEQHLDAAESQPQAEIMTFVIGPMKHARAADMAKLLKEVYAGERSPRGFSATADVRTNNLVLRCTRPLFEDAKRVVDQLDTPGDAAK